MANKTDTNPGKPEFGPSDRLIAIFRSCSRDPAEVIQSRLRVMLDKFLQHHKSCAGHEEANEVAEQCCYQAGLWYYRLLEKHAIRECRRLGNSDISIMLSNKDYHGSLLVCCLLVTTFSNNLQYDFTLLLQILQLTVYPFVMVIEPVLRDERCLKRHVTKYLAQVEEKILESLAWTSDSPLWEKIRANRGHLPTCQQVMPPHMLENQKSTQLDGNFPGVSSLRVGQPSTSAEYQPQRCNSLALFSRKVYLLMDHRLREMCCKLDIDDELQLKIWTVFEHSLVNFTELLVDRHLDQLLMCSIYLTAKVTDNEILFKDIMAYYKSQPLNSRSVCRNVLISGKNKENSLTGNNAADNEDIRAVFPTPDTPSAHYPDPGQEERGNLIKFYNTVYSTKMHDFAMKFAAPAGIGTPMSLSPRPYKASICKSRLSGRHSTFISTPNTATPLQQTPGLLNSDPSRPSEQPREMNNMVSGSPQWNRRSRVALSMNRAEEEEAGPSARRRRLDGQSFLQSRLMSVQNDRLARKDRA